MSRVRKFLEWALASALALSLAPASAKPPAQPASAAGAIAQPASAPHEPQLVEDGHYTNISGAVVHPPAHSAMRPA